jgi:hypothetical protein
MNFPSRFNFKTNKQREVILHQQLSPLHFHRAQMLFELPERKLPRRAHKRFELRSFARLATAKLALNELISASNVRCMLVLQLDM